REQEIEIGHYSGESNVVYWLRKRGYEPTTDLVAAVLDHAKRSNRVLSDEEIVHCIKEHRAGGAAKAAST
ncbi:MAG: 2-isopropylmalate synthase, partial [Myxococcales bacterium]|nr:2-isopropylmalate synthase [Myxococcales bacterium]